MFIYINISVSHSKLSKYEIPRKLTMCDYRQNSNGPSNGRSNKYIIRSLLFIKGKGTSKRLLQVAKGITSKSKTHSFILTEKMSTYFTEMHFYFL